MFCQYDTVSPEDDAPGGLEPTPYELACQAYYQERELERPVPRSEQFSRDRLGDNFPVESHGKHVQACGLAHGSEGKSELLCFYAYYRYYRSLKGIP